MNVGIVGFGKMGRIRLKEILNLGGHSVIKICDTHRHDIPNDIEWCDNYEEVVTDNNINAVFICTPNFLIKDAIVKCLKAGKHVFSEKPPARNFTEFQEIYQVAKECSPLKLMYGFNHRHHDSLILAKQLIESGEFGKILWMRGRYGKSVDSNFLNTWRAKKEMAGGGILLDQGIHMLDLFLMMCDDFEEVHSFVSNIYWNLDIEDNVFAIFRNRNGQVASLHSTMTQWRHLFSFEIFLERGHISINGLLTSSRTYGEEEISISRNMGFGPEVTLSTEKRIYGIDKSFHRETKIFFDCVENNIPVPIGNPDDALKLMRLIDKVYKCDSK